MNYEETLEVLSLRIFPAMLKRIDSMMELDIEGIFENRSHFIRCSINHFLNSARVKKIIKVEDD